MTFTKIIAEAKTNIEALSLELVEVKHGSERAKEINSLISKYKAVKDDAENQILNFLQQL